VLARLLAALRVPLGEEHVGAGGHGPARLQRRSGARGVYVVKGGAGRRVPCGLPSGSSRSRPFSPDVRSSATVASPSRTSPTRSRRGSALGRRRGGTFWSGSARRTGSPGTGRRRRCRRAGSGRAPSRTATTRRSATSPSSCSAPSTCAFRCRRRRS
jgi:hypothetical protein